MDKLKNPALLLSALVMLIGGVLLLVESDSILGVLFFFPLSLGPLLLSAALAPSLNSRSRQTILCVGSILYGLWFGYIYASAFYWHVDPQSAIALVFVGIYSLPVMIPVWIASYLLKNHGKNPGEHVKVANP